MTSDLTIRARIGKKRVLVIPKRIAEKLNCYDLYCQIKDESKGISSTEVNDNTGEQTAMSAHYTGETL